MSGNIFSVSIIRTLDGVPKWLPHEVGKDEHWKLSLLMMSQLLLLLWMLRIMMLENLSLLLLLLMLLLMTRPRLRCHIKTEISKFVWPGTNILYKTNGSERYPDFKLYKMIARCVHKHTPQAQLDRPEFKAFSNFKGEVPNDFIDIDKIPVYTN